MGSSIVNDDGDDDDDDDEFINSVVFNIVSDCSKIRTAGNFKWEIIPDTGCSREECFYGGLLLS